LESTTTIVTTNGIHIKLFGVLIQLTFQYKDNFINLAKQGYEAYNKSQSHGDSGNDVDCRCLLLSIIRANPFDSIRATLTQPAIARQVERNTTLLTTLSKEAVNLIVLIFIHIRRLIDLITSFVHARTVSVDHDEVVNAAKAHHDGSGDNSMFSSAHSYISQNTVRREVPRIIVYLRLNHIPQLKESTP
jgi:hypothetical protein